MLTSVSTRAEWRFAMMQTLGGGATSSTGGRRGTHSRATGAEEAQSFAAAKGLTGMVAATLAEAHRAGDIRGTGQMHMTRDGKQSSTHGQGDIEIMKGTDAMSTGAEMSETMMAGKMSGPLDSKIGGSPKICAMAVDLNCPISAIWQ